VRTPNRASFVDGLPTGRLIGEFSLWSADLLRLADDLARIGPHADMLHIDVADGRFAPALLFFPDTLVHGSVRLASGAGWRSGAAPATIPGPLPCRSRPMLLAATASRGSGTGSPTGPRTRPPSGSAAA
jgi:hypothetical protein